MSSDVAFRAGAYHVALRCHCGGSRALVAASLAEARAHLEAEGWRISEHLSDGACPACRRREAPR